MYRIKIILLIISLFYSCVNKENDLIESSYAEIAYQSAFIQLTDYESKSSYIDKLSSMIDSLFESSKGIEKTFLRETILINELILEISEELLKLYDLNHENITNFREMNESEVIVFLDFKKPVNIMFGANIGSEENISMAISLQAHLNAYNRQFFRTKKNNFIRRYLTDKYFSKDKYKQSWAMTLDSRSLINILNQLAELRINIYIFTLNEIYEGNCRSAIHDDKQESE